MSNLVHELPNLVNQNISNFQDFDRNIWNNFPIQTGFSGLLHPLQPANDTHFITLCSLLLLDSGLRSRSRVWSWSRSESTILPGVGVGAGISKILSTPTPARSRRIPPVNRQWSGPNGYPSSRKRWKTGKTEECQYRDKVEASFGDKIRSGKLVWNVTLGPSRSLYDFINKKGLSYRSQSAITTSGITIKKSAMTTSGYIRSSRERVTYCPMNFGCNQKGNQENGSIILLLSEWNISS